MKRFSGLDFIRSLAIFSVIGGHFYMNTGFQNEEFGEATILTVYGQNESAELS